MGVVSREVGRDTDPQHVAVSVQKTCTFIYCQGKQYEYAPCPTSLCPSQLITILLETQLNKWAEQTMVEK